MLVRNNVYTTKCVSIGFSFVSRCFCRSIRLRGHWNTPREREEIERFCVCVCVSTDSWGFKAPQSFWTSMYMRSGCLLFPYLSSLSKSCRVSGACRDSRDLLIDKIPFEMTLCFHSRDCELRCVLQCHIHSS